MGNEWTTFRDYLSKHFNVSYFLWFFFLQIVFFLNRVCISFLFSSFLLLLFTFLVFIIPFSFPRVYWSFFYSSCLLIFCFHLIIIPSLSYVFISPFPLPISFSFLSSSSLLTPLSCLPPLPPIPSHPIYLSFVHSPYLSLLSLSLFRRPSRRSSSLHTNTVWSHTRKRRRRWRNTRRRTGRIREPWIRK